MSYIPAAIRNKIQVAKEQQQRELDLSSRTTGYYLKEIPIEVFELEQLEKLDLRFNYIKEVPKEIFKLKNLKYLDLIGNRKLTGISQQLIQLSSLIYLGVVLDINESLPNWLKQIPKLGLDFSNHRLTEIPNAIFQLQNLTVLHLNDNQLTSLPESISKLTSLTHLHLSSNQLTSLPKSISKLTSLTCLNLSVNQLISLPEFITKLTSLTWLDLSFNQLTSLPESISKLTSLTQLHLSVNLLTSLPEFISKLTSLTHLCLVSNQLTTFPESISKLTSLTELYLSSNQLTSLPESISKLTSLTELYLEDNPLETPPIEIAVKGIEKIRDYFRQIEQGIDYLYEAKLIIVGAGGAGKTTLANKIINSDYKLNPEEKFTKGIDILKWGFPIKDKKGLERQFKVNIWDFGGQEIYHTTHQFFLTKRSLYVLVADTRKEDTDFPYWLNIVELLSDRSPLIIVKNEKGDRTIQVIERQLRGQFLNLKEALACNLADNRGLDNIKENVKDYIKKLPHIGNTLPKTWKQVRDVLEKDKQNYISLQEYLKICDNNGFKKQKDKLQLSGYLHDLGVILHFQEDLILSQTVILKPEWGTDAIYKVLDNKKVINNLGKFSNYDLLNIWNEEQYDGKQVELLQLMKKFQLCYQIPGSNDTYIAPQLLKLEQPTYDWNEDNNLLLRYTYEFMPKGIVTRFIVVMHSLIEKQQLVWRSGVILHKNQTRAEVIEYYDQRRISIRVSGKNRKDLMTIVTYELDKIHASYKRLKYQKLIPCNCYKCKNTQEPDFYPFDILKQFVRDGQQDIQCKKSYQMVNVLSLIDDITSGKAIDDKLDTDSDKEIEIYKQQIRELSEIAKLASRQPIKVEATAMVGDNIDQSQDINIEDSKNIKIKGSTFSTNRENISKEKDSKITKKLGIAASIAGIIAAIATILALLF